MGSFVTGGAFVRSLTIMTSVPVFAIALQGSALAQPAPSPSPSVAPSAAPMAPMPGASAQPSAQPQGPTEPKSAVPNPAPPPNKMNYLPTIDIIPQSTFATGTDFTQGQPAHNGVTKIGGKITQAILSNLSASYQHGYIDETIGNSGFPINGYVSDPTDDFRLNYTASKALSAAVGYFYRHRTCCPASNDPTNLQPITVHEAYLELGYAFPAIQALNGAQFSLNGRATQTLAHHPAPRSVLLANPQIHGDEGNRIWPTGGASLVVPIDKKNGFNVFGTYSYAKDYFDYQPIAFWYNIVDYGFTRVVNPVLSFTFDTTNLTQHRQGYPFPNFNAIHRTKFVLSADIHLSAK